jgi:copper(I)-binding protein
MTRRTMRTSLISAASVAAGLSLALSAVAAQEDGADETGMMASMEPAAETGAMPPGLHVVDPWARESPMLDLAGAAYMIIRNDTDADDALVGAASPVAEVVELHLSSMDAEGMMSMNQVMEIPLPAHADAVLEPGGYHVMLIGLTEPLVADTEFELSLEFMTAEPQTIVLPVRAGASMVMDDDGMADDTGMADDMDMDMDEEEGED